MYDRGRRSRLFSCTRADSATRWLEQTRRSRCTGTSYCIYRFGRIAPPFDAAQMAATERPRATGRGYGVPPLSVADLVEEARKISAREIARDRRSRETQGAWSGNSVFELETQFATRHGKLLPQETLRPKKLLTGRPHFDGAFAPEAYPNARGASPRAPVGRETRLYVVRLSESKFFVGTFHVGRDETDLSNLHARLEAHRRGDCRWTRRYPPADGDDALYWFQRDHHPRRAGEEPRRRNAAASTDSPSAAEDALVERLMLERHERHGLDVVRGGSYTSARLGDHTKRALSDAFFLRAGNPACAVCGGAHASKRCGERRAAARAYAAWRRARDDDVFSETADGSSPGADGPLEPYADDERGSEGRAFAKETFAASEGASEGASGSEGKAGGAASAGESETAGKWTEAEESDLLRALHAGFAGAGEVARLARERGRTEQDVLARIRVLRGRV